MREDGLSIDGVMELLNKKSGLQGVSGKSLDTRILMKAYDTDLRAKLAMDMFSYRVLKAVGACLAALDGAQAVIFGGGIDENTLLVRRKVCDGLEWCGLEMGENRNRTLIDIEGRLSTERSAIQAWVYPSKRACKWPRVLSRIWQKKSFPDRKNRANRQPSSRILAAQCIAWKSDCNPLVRSMNWINCQEAIPFSSRGPAMTDAIRTRPQIESSAGPNRALSGETSQ